MKHAWVISEPGVREDEPVAVAQTKAAAKRWIKQQDSRLVFTGEERDYFAARTNERDWVTRFTAWKLPFIS